MADAAIAKVENAFQALLQTVSALSAYTVLTDQSKDIPIEPDHSITIYTTSYEVLQADELNQMEHIAVIEFEVVEPTAQPGKISHNSHTAIATIAGTLGANRELGGRLIDTMPIDVAPSLGQGRDITSTTLRARVSFFTSLTDWFTILGQPTGNNF